MRQPIILSALACVLSSAPAFAQTYTATIMQKDVEVRSGPSTQFFPTSKLNQNDKILVLRESKEAPGWLEIVPPPGSFSWINAKHVKFAKPGDRLGAVDPDPPQAVSVLPGSVLVDQPPNRESMKLTPGVVVEVIERPLTLQGETWLPIRPHPNEVRYVPASAVKGAVTVAPATSVGPTTWKQTPLGYSKDPLIAEADKELEAGNKDRAKQLYWAAANSTTIDANGKAYAQNRYSLLTNPTVPGTTTSMSPGTLPPNTAVKLQTLRGAEWSVYGRLAETKLASDNGQPLYTLDDGRGGLPVYVTVVPGKSLQSYIGRWVSVYGPTMYRPEPRMQYIVASHVAVP